ncbi:lipopolysaccharide assembly protein LapB [Candidatus Enterovibrio altilux]|uniref:Lipopolysaccharide assembly protein B n=1 Tax=Candidatus Enterovibrio altilux TaxID=1927128 RepID=A0A291BBG6_9GAMM|nr:lipopolysaccharide assembly protein LapB [Candidatus Enterovibrio luxaltus]ATF10352.1 Heat shock (predicted periplasmic) protein YciM, precursor [Candidatus Enterovibrio luxaltus]
MLELLFLLLPIAAGYGWYMGNRNTRYRRQDQSHHLSRQYVAGLNLLLSDQSDKAVDLFIELLQVDNETIDTHLTLGNLFRSRGEVDRAIRIHQNLIARPNLTQDQRNLALQQLAKDYMVAGFFDRAEKIFHQLIGEPDYKEFALQQLLAIYQQTREWEKAIEIASRLVKAGKNKLKRDISHFYCELAMQSTTDSDDKVVRQLLRKALSVDKSCVRASLILARLDIDEKDYKGAVKLLESVLDQDPDFVSEALPMLEGCYHDMEKNMAFVRFLKLCIEKNTGVSAELMMSDIINCHENAAMAQTFLTRQLTKNPTMKGFHKLMELHVEQAEEGRAKSSLNTLKHLVEEQLKIKPNYRCWKCGFSTHALYWHCPSCKGWGLIKPIKGLDGE